MKKISKILLVAAFAVFGAQAFAQTFGVVGGLNMSNLTMKDDDAS